MRDRFILALRHRCNMIIHLTEFWIRACLLVIIIMFIPTICKTQNLLNGPQKIVVDSKRNRLLVSNYNTGDIIQIDNSGNQSYFIRDAGFVDGLEIAGDSIYGVGNNRRVKGYNLITKKMVMNITIPGSDSNYLSSIASDSAGHLFISCPYLNEIYKLRLSDRSYWVFAKGNGLHYPNGILLEKEKNRIVVIDDSPENTLIHSISLSDSTVSAIISAPLNRPDGIIRDEEGNHYIGGYYLPGIYKTDAEFSHAPELFYKGNNTVYLTFDRASDSILITHYNTNTWERVFLKTIPDSKGSKP